MRYLFLSIFLTIIALPFGPLPLMIAVSIASGLQFAESRDYRVLSSLIFGLLSFLYLPLGILALIPMLLFSREEPFMQVVVFLAAVALGFIAFPVVYLFVMAPPWNSPTGMYDALLTSMVASTVATLVGVALSLPLGYVLARRDFPGKEVVEGIVDLPIVIPHTVAGIILLLVFGTSGIIGEPLEEIGIRFYYALPGIVIAMLFVSIPFLINQVREGVEKVDERYEFVAMSLGASRTRAFFTVVLPQIRRNLLAGAINAWARAMSEFGAVIMIAFYPMIAPTYIYYLFTNFGLKATLPATSFLLAITLAMFIALRAVSGRFTNAGDR